MMEKVKSRASSYRIDVSGVPISEMLRIPLMIPATSSKKYDAKNAIPQEERLATSPN